jgi:hypothetical protein
MLLRIIVIHTNYRSDQQGKLRIKLFKGKSISYDIYCKQKCIRSLVFQNKDGINQKNLIAELQYRSMVISISRIWLVVFVRITSFIARRINLS